MEDIKTILSKSNNTTLIQHSFDVARVAYDIANNLTNDKNIISSVVIAALFHDIGKCVSDFQKHLINDEYSNYIPHNILGASIVHKYVSINGDSSCNAINNIIRAILYHHPTNFKKLDITTIDNWDFMEVISNDDVKLIESFVNYFIEEYNEYNLPLRLYKKQLTNTHDINDSYFVDGHYKDISFFIISNIIKFADFVVSSGANKDNYINGNYPADIDFIKPTHYDDRFYTQIEYANKCSNYRLSIFSAQTGFGKTMTGIKYLLNNGKKGYWICPRNTIAEGLYSTITKELKMLGLEDKVSVALLLTNKWVYGDNNCDIIVTNIDNFVRPSIKTDANTYSYNMLYCNCIFDEFHEYVDNQALMSLFNIIIHSRFMCCNSKTLLLSATPIFNFVNDIKDDENFKYFNYNYEPIQSKKYKLYYGDKLKLDYLKNKNWLISANSIKTTQDIFMSDCVDNIIHANFTETDLSERLKILYNEHGKGCNISTSWVATNILSTGIDVSFGNIMISWPTPERMIQAMGRCNRWNECKEIPLLYLFKDSSDFVEKCGVDAFTDSVLAIKFYNYLTSIFNNGDIITLKDIYKARDDFYEQEKSFYTKLFNNTLKESRDNLKKLSYEYTTKIDSNDEIKYISNKNGLRKNDTIYSFFFKVIDDNTGVFIEDIMQGDNRRMNMDIIKSNTSIEYIYKSIKKYNVNLYFKSKKHMDKVYEKSKNIFWEIVYKKAICSETPLLIANNYYYNKNIGLYRKK